MKRAPHTQINLADGSDDLIGFKITMQVGSTETPNDWVLYNALVILFALEANEAISTRSHSALRPLHCSVWAYPLFGWSSKYRKTIPRLN